MGGGGGKNMEKNIEQDDLAQKNRLTHEKKSSKKKCVPSPIKTQMVRPLSRMFALLKEVTSSSTAKT